RGGLDETAAGAIRIALASRTAVGHQQMGPVEVGTQAWGYRFPSRRIAWSLSHKLRSSGVALGGLVLRRGSFFLRLGVSEARRTHPVLGSPELALAPARRAVLRLTAVGFLMASGTRVPTD